MNAVKPNTPLTERETEILIFVAKGCTNSDIARLLNKSKSTVDGYLKDILQRLDVDTRVEAAVWAAKQGIV